MTPAEAQARYVLGSLKVWEVAPFATAMLAKGHDGKALRELAWEHDSWWDVAELFKQALVELGRGPMSDEDACWVIIQLLVRDIVEGRLAPLDGIELIYGNWYSHLETTRPGLYGIYQLYRELEVHWEPTPDMTQAWEDRAVVLARALLDEGTGPESDLEPGLSRTTERTGLEPTL